MWLTQETHYLNVHSTCNYWSIQSNASFIHKVINNCCKMGGKKNLNPVKGNIYTMMYCEEDKIWDKAWRAQQAHVHRPKEGRAYPLCGPLTERGPRLAHQVSDSWKLALQGGDLLCKDEACSARMRLALQKWDLLCKEKTYFTKKEAVPHYYKKPQHPHKKVRVTNPSLAL